MLNGIMVFINMKSFAECTVLLEGNLPLLSMPVTCSVQMAPPDIKHK
jgi:hypothetical protein